MFLEMFDSILTYPKAWAESSLQAKSPRAVYPVENYSLHVWQLAYSVSYIACKISFNIRYSTNV